MEKNLSCIICFPCNLYLLTPNFIVAFIFSWYGIKPVVGGQMDKRQTQWTETVTFHVLKNVPYFENPCKKYTD